MKLSAKVVALTFVGGAIGTLLRFSLTLIPEFFFTNYWAANLAGASLIALFNNLAWFSSDARRAFFTVGFTGGFTTMSALTMLTLYSWPTVVAQLLLGVAIYLATTLVIARTNRG